MPLTGNTKPTGIEMRTTPFIQSRLPRRHFLARCSVCMSAGFVPSILFARQQRQPSAGPGALDSVDDLVAANRILAQEGVVDAYGHVSARHTRATNRFLLSRSVAPELVTAADVMEYDLEGNAVSPSGRSSYLERFIHSEIYKARSDVNAIVHCHTPSIIPFGASTVRLQPMYHMSSFIAEGVPVFDIRDAGGMTDMLVGDARLGRALAAVLADKPAALMRGHGAVVVGHTIPTVVGRSIYLDVNARLQAEAIALGGTVTYLDSEEARRWDAANGTYDRAWELWKRKAIPK
jgi:ribulose-5-phosphate 4-epimerase/fuculose-1-phosphate aldolase